MTHQNAAAIASFHEELLQHIKYQGAGTKRVLVCTESRADVADAPTRSYITNQQGSKIAILFVSNDVNPDLVQRSVHNSVQAKKILGEKLGSVILDPIASGLYENRSFSIWPLQRDFSTNFILRRIQKAFVVPRVLHWLEAAARQTLCTDIGPKMKEKIYLRPLLKISEDSRYPSHFRELTVNALTQIEAGKLQPVTVLEHSDLWLGNIVLPQKRRERFGAPFPFYIIDWSGADLSGIPFYDLLRFADSACINKTRLSIQISRRCELLGCEFAEAKLYLVAALAKLGMKLECFPEHRYITVCKRVLDLLVNLK